MFKNFLYGLLCIAMIMLFSPIIVVVMISTLLFKVVSGIGSDFLEGIEQGRKGKND